MITTLDRLREGDRATVHAILGGHGIRRRLESLGVHPGDVVAVVRIASMGGPVLIEIHGARVAVGRGMAQRIEVETAIVVKEE
jgi:ferrous iron transport protein A